MAEFSRHKRKKATFRKSVITCKLYQYQYYTETYPLQSKCQHAAAAFKCRENICVLTYSACICLRLTAKWRNPTYIPSVMYIGIFTKLLRYDLQFLSCTEYYDMLWDSNALTQIALTRAIPPVWGYQNPNKRPPDAER